MHNLTVCIVYQNNNKKLEIALFNVDNKPQCYNSMWTKRLWGTVVHLGPTWWNVCCSIQPLQHWSRWWATCVQPHSLGTDTIWWSCPHCQGRWWRFCVLQERIERLTPDRGKNDERTGLTFGAEVTPNLGKQETHGGTRGRGATGAVLWTERKTSGGR